VQCIILRPGLGSGVDRRAHSSDVGIPSGDLEGSVRGSIVYHDDLLGGDGLTEQGVQRVRQTPLLVVGRDDDSDRQRPGSSQRLRNLMTAPTTVTPTPTAAYTIVLNPVIGRPVYIPVLLARVVVKALWHVRREDRSPVVVAQVHTCPPFRRSLGYVHHGSLILSGMQVRVGRR